jgi:dodecin
VFVTVGRERCCELRFGAHMQTMSIAKITEISAQSPTSFEDAIQEGITRASKTIRNIQTAWIKEQQVVVNEQGHITNYRVGMKITFLLDE